MFAQRQKVIKRDYFGGAPVSTTTPQVSHCFFMIGPHSSDSSNLVHISTK